MFVVNEYTYKEARSEAILFILPYHVLLTKSTRVESHISIRVNKYSKFINLNCEPALEILNNKHKIGKLNYT